MTFVSINFKNLINFTVHVLIIVNIHLQLAKICNFKHTKLVIVNIHLLTCKKGRMGNTVPYNIQVLTRASVTRVTFLQFYSARYIFN